MTSLGLGGFIHLWGTAGSGKTLLAVALAADISKYAKVEWINTDGKKSFVRYLKRNIEASGGRSDNVTITMTDDQPELLELIQTLPGSDLPSLIVIDPITRVLDLARDDPTLWGREIVEDVLPTLAGMVTANDLAIVITSESRMLEDFETRAVHHSTITKWIDHDLCLNRDMSGSLTHIVRKIEDVEQETAQLRVDQTGVLEIIPSIYPPRVSEGV
ncbi:MAG: AAA family ATPase [Candidatus Thorarchaeota archaeon]